MAHFLPTHSSAVVRNERWYLSWLTPWFVYLSTPVPSWDKATYRFAVGGSLGDGAFAASSSDTDAVDDKALFGLVS